MLRRARTPLAWLLLSADKSRLALSVARIAFAVVLMFSQLGFLLGVADSQRGLIDALDADLVMSSAVRYNVFIDESFPRARLHQALAAHGVRSACPLYIEDWDYWRSPTDGGEHHVRVLAVRVEDPVFLDPKLQGQLGLLKDEDTALFDARSRSFFGTVAAGTAAEVNRRRVRIRGLFVLGPDYRYDGTLIMSEANLFRIFPDRRPEAPSLGLLRLEPGTDPEAEAAALNNNLPPDVVVMSREAFGRQEASFWDEQTSTGIVFGFGLFVGFLVGAITCYQILYTNVTDHLPQLATLKALGYSNRFLTRLVVEEAILLALLGFAPGAVLSAGLYALLQGTTGIRMQMTLPRSAILLALTLGMCAAAAVVAARKAQKADPAEVF